MPPPCAPPPLRRPARLRQRRIARARPAWPARRCLPLAHLPSRRACGRAPRPSPRRDCASRCCLWRPARAAAVPPSLCRIEACASATPRPTRRGK
eukprot:2746106-Pleurochrysis_carterae.AAC.4